MKKYFYFLSLLLLLVSCTSEDVSSSNKAFQTLKDNVFWRAQVYKAETETNGMFTIEGSLDNDLIRIELPELAEKKYTLGIDDNAKAIYKNSEKGQEIEFSTGTDKGNGEIIVTEYNAVDNTVSGTFKFTAVNNDANAIKQSIHFSEGVFYKIPIISEANFTVN